MAEGQPEHGPRHRPASGRTFVFPPCLSLPRRRRPASGSHWWMLRAVLFFALGMLGTGAALTVPAGGRPGGSGVDTPAELLAADRQRAEAGLGRDTWVPGAAPGTAVASEPQPTPEPAPPSPGDPQPRGEPAPGLGAASEQEPGQEDAQAVRRRLAELATQVGLTPVRGPALTVELDDAPRESRGTPRAAGVPPPTPDDLVVHEQDVQAVVNALWAGGAEAMAVMDQRVTPRTAVRCVGNTLLLHGKVYSPPFRVSAIGDPQRLRAALDTDPGVLLYRQYVDAYGLGYRVWASDDLLLPAYQGDLLTN